MRIEFQKQSSGNFIGRMYHRLVGSVFCLGVGWLFLATEVNGQEPDGGFVYGAWLPYWGMKEGKKSLEGGHHLNALSPVWYEVREDGSLETKIKTSAAFLKDASKRQGMALTPSLAIFDYKHLAKIIGDPENRKRHVDAIVAEVMSQNFDGIDIDYEAIGIENKEDYFLFLESLSKDLRKLGKTLSVTVLSKWGDDVEYRILPQTHEVQDWKRLGELADEVRIMAYDYTFPKSKYPGPIAPDSWVKDVLEYAITKIPREKIILGIHLYGYEWRSTDGELKVERDMDENPLGEGRARSFTYDVIQNILKKNQGKLKRTDGELIYRYSVKKGGQGTEYRVLIFPGKKETEGKVDLARKYKIGGVFFWRLGGEGDLHHLKKE
jgi:spore germination protein